MLNLAAPAQTLFIKQAKRTLDFWRDETRHINNPEVVKKLESERQNLFQAVQMGLRFPEMGGETAVILSQAMPYIAQRGYWQDWIPLLQQCLQIESNQTPSRRVDLLINLGRAYCLDKQLDRAIEIHLEAKQIAQANGQSPALAQVQHDLLEDYYFSRAFNQAKNAGQLAIQMLEETNGSKTLLANCYKMLGSVFYESEETKTAENYFSKAVAMRRQIGDPIHTARTLNDYSRLLLTLERYDQAERCLIEAEALLASTINELDKCMVQVNLGSVYSAQQNWTKAETAFHKANSPYLRQSIDLTLKARVNNNLGYVLFRQEMYESAEEYLRQGLQLWQEIGNDLEYANTLSILADCVLARLGSIAALSLYDELLLILTNYPQNTYARKLNREYTEIRDQIKEVLAEKQSTCT